jgi:hypothetical protein
MRFLNRFFKRTKKEENIYPSRTLNLQYEIYAANANRFAEQFKEAVKKLENLELDYSVKSIELVNSFLEKFRKEGLAVNDFAETIFLAGCYVGEVFVKNKKGTWIDAKDFAQHFPPGFSPTSILLKVGESKFADPIVKAYKRFSLGEAESLTYFYEVFAKDAN